MDDAGISSWLQQIATNASLSNQQMGSLIKVLATIFPFSGVTGSFTCAAAATTVVTNANVKANSKIFLMATNASAGTLQGSAKSLYISAKTAGTSFTIATASAASAAGTETFDFLIVNPTG